MKGIFTDIGFTVAVLITAVIVILAMLVLFVIFEFKGKDPMSYSLGFVDLSNKPYLLSGSLLHLKIDDRQFIEHAIEASVVGSLANSRSVGVKQLLKDFMNKYILDYYNVKVSYNNNEIFSIDSLLDKCGPAGNKEGYCIRAGTSVPHCEVGWIQIPKEETDCSESYTEYLPEGGAITGTNYACCKYDIETYKQTGIYEIRQCGNYGIGVCSEHCSEASIQLNEGNAECNDNDLNEGLTKICCAQKSLDVATQTGYATSAEIPLFYRDKFSSLVVTVSE